MKNCKLFLVFVFLSFADVYAHTGDSITVPYGTTPVIDGAKSAGEWSDAFLISVLTNGFYNDIYVKHSTTHLFVAFESPYATSVGIYIDKIHNGGSLPQTDDIWIHGSAGPFEFAGNGNSWIQQTAAANWNFVSNISNQFSEFQISLSKLGLSIGNNVLGILFSLIDWSVSHTDEITWPSGGYPNCGNPNSWANMNISFVNSIADNSGSINKLKVFPDINREFLIVEGVNTECLDFSIYNLMGESIKTGKFDKNISNINISALNSGIYFIQFKSKSNSRTFKFVRR
jgi:hypothetical protein